MNSLLLLLQLLLLQISTATSLITLASSSQTYQTLVESQEPITPTHHLHTLTHKKLTHVRFYWHDIFSGPQPTAVPVASAPSTKTSLTGFGLINMIDDPLTLGPNINSSKLVGRAQGLYASASQETVGLIMAMNFVFLEGKYNGSTITVMGRNEVLSEMREMAVVGGSGLFRWATGYVQARTHNFNPKTGDACVHYDCFIMHY